MSFFVDGNYLEEIPKTVGFANVLKNFGVNNNYISNIPNEIGMLHNIHDIDLRNSNRTSPKRN